MIVSSEKHMLQIANNLGSRLTESIDQDMVIYLRGELGSGKTTFSKGFIKGLGYQDLITSPTFSLVERIKTEKFYILHIDLYRIERPEEIIELELHEEPNNLKPTVMLIEWPEKGHELILPADIEIFFTMAKDIDQRIIELSNQTNKLGNKIDFG
jgi:tRNA threonylcarbamoyladenosine biosynthesis protein TsaE